MSGLFRLCKWVYNRLKNYKPKADSLITVMAFGLIIFGGVFSISASMNYSTTTATTFNSVIKQTAFSVLAIAAYFFMTKVFVLKECRRYIKIIAILEFLFMLAAWIYCLVHGAINGNYSWIPLVFGASIQPSEFAKIVLVLSIACLVADKKFRAVKRNFDCYKTPLTILIAYVIVIALLQHDMGTCVVCICIGCGCYLVPNNKKLRNSQLFLSFAAVACITVLVLLLVTPAGRNFVMSHDGTIFNRFRAVFDPSYTDDGTREIFYSLLSISKGSFWGVGIGNSVLKFGYLVASESDYAFAIIVEEIGIFGILIVFGGYIILILRLLYYANRVDNEGSRTIIVGTILYLFVHFFFNVGGVSGLIPLTGVPLLFISRGGSALLSIMMMLGICQAEISEYWYKKQKAKEVLIFK